MVPPMALPTYPFRAMNEMSHIDDEGHARMVDVGNKSETRRRASSEVYVELGQKAYAVLMSEGSPKGDALAVARIAGIQGAKRCSELIPLCHPLALEQIQVDLEPVPGRHAIRITCEATLSGKTGVEMEAMTGASVAALALYDMCKALDKGIRIEGLRLIRKEGGKSGTWVATEMDSATKPSKTAPGGVASDSKEGR